MKSFSKRLILLDSHAILHRAYHALPDFSTAAGVPTGALYGLSLMLLRIVEDFKPDYIVATYDLPKPTYRHEAYKDYKAGRAKTDEALVEQIKSSRKIFDAFNIPIYDQQGFEADDVIGTIVEDTKKEKNLEVIIASGDMDTLQLVSGEKVKVFTLKKGIKDTILYDEKAVKDRFGFGPEFIIDYKGLRGDPSDNIPGIKGIGEKTATILISEFGSVEDIYKELKKGDENFLRAKITPRIIELLRNGKEDAEFSKMLATIRRDAPIGFVVPKQTFAENIDFTKIETLFSEFEFRTLAPRLKAILGKQSGTTTETESGSLVRSEDSAKTTRSPDSISSVVPSEEKFKEAQIMLWLLNSNISDPKIEDIFAHTGTKNFDEAYEKLSKEIGDKKLSFVYDEVEKPLIPIVDSMKSIGVKIDKSYLKKLSEEYHKELNTLEKSIWDMAGEEFNIASPKQLGEVLFVKLGLKSKKKTAGGALSTKESELEKLADEHPIIGEILKYRELAKLLGTYIDVIPTLLDEHCRIHPTSIQTGSGDRTYGDKRPEHSKYSQQKRVGPKNQRRFYYR